MINLYPVVILAGGLGSRLYPVTADIPKSMILVNGKPFIYHQIRLLKDRGFENIIICVNYLGEQIVKYVNNFFGDSNIIYSFDGKKYLGTGGAIKKILPWIENNFFVVYGDSYLDRIYRSIQQKFSHSNKLGLMTVYENNNKYGRSNITYKNNEILYYDKNSKTPLKYIDYGINIFNREVFDLFKSDVFDLSKVQTYLIKKKQMEAFLVTERFYEIGSNKGISDLARYLKDKSKESGCL